MATPAVPLHINTLVSGILPPFLGILIAVLSHYQIHVLHLDPGSLVLLSPFAFLCEAFVGVTPFVALLRHFFFLELVSKEQCSGYAFLKAANASVPGALDAELLPEAEGFQRQWVQVETVEAGAMFQPPSTPATLNRGWMREELNYPQLAPVLTRLEKLKKVGVMMAMVVWEFICQRIAPLKRHSRLMWAYAGPCDPMRVQVMPLSPDVLHELLRRLTGGDPDELPHNGLPLYNFKAPEAIIVGMPLFDEWRFLPGGDARPRVASTLGVQTHENSGHAAPSAAGVGGVSPPAPTALAPGQAGVVVDDRSTVEVTTPASKLQPRAAGSPRRATRVGRNRSSPEGGRPSTRWAPVKKKWVAVDEVSTGDRGGGSVFPVPEIAEHLVVSYPAPSGVQHPESLAREPPAVFLACGLWLPRRVLFPSPAVVLCLPSRPLPLGDGGPQGAPPSDEASAREPPASEHGSRLRDSSRASPIHHVESERSCWPLGPVEVVRVAPWGLFRTVADTLQRLGAALSSNEVRLKDDRMYLASGWRQLEVAVNLRRLQRERARVEAEESLAATVEARERALFEAREADCQRMVSENRHRELCALNADLEEQAGLGSRASVDSLALVEVEQSLEQERLEVRERQVSLDEESLASRQAKLEEDIDRGVADARHSLLLDYRAKLRLQESRFRERRGHMNNEVDALRKRLDQEVKRRHVALDA
ncbi:hypothetical protein D1007_50281 [Hordeum vulgare]|nr:hypothetical protein D1007_50281 [Hordeum vulgare]